jgi:hypothetical protein
MEPSDQICAAPSCPNEQCYPSQHCEEHSGFFINLYRKYKNIENTLKDVINLSILPNSIAELLKIYAKLKQVYELRKDFREKAFRKEKWDSGHEIRLNIILDKMFAVENKLEESFNKHTSIELIPYNALSESTEDLMEDSTKESISNEIQTIKEFNLKAIEELKVWNEEIPVLIKENVEAFKAADNYITLIYNNVYRIISTKEENFQNIIDTHTDDQIQQLCETISLYVFSFYYLFQQLVTYIDRWAYGKYNLLMTSSDNMKWVIYMAKMDKNESIINGVIRNILLTSSSILIAMVIFLYQNYFNFGLKIVKRQKFITFAEIINMEKRGKIVMKNKVNGGFSGIIYKVAAIAGNQQPIFGFKDFARI